MKELRACKITDNRNLTSEKINQYKKAGYSHYISFLVRSKVLDNIIYKEGFATTADAIGIHCKVIKKRNGEPEVIKL